MDSSNWIASIINALSSFLEKNGFSATMFAAGFFMVWWFGSKFMDNVAKPAAERMLNMADRVSEGQDRFVDSTIASTRKMEICIENQGKTLDELKEHSATHTQLLTLISEQTKPLMKIVPPTRKAK